MTNVAATGTKSTSPSMAPRSGVHRAARNAANEAPTLGLYAGDGNPDDRGLARCAEHLLCHAEGVREEIATMMSVFHAYECHHSPATPGDAATIRKFEDAYLMCQRELTGIDETVDRLTSLRDASVKSTAPVAPSDNTGHAYQPRRRDAVDDSTGDATVGDLARMFLVHADRPLAEAALETFADELAELQTVMRCNDRSGFVPENTLWRIERRMRAMAEFAFRARRERKASKSAREASATMPPPPKVPR